MIELHLSDSFWRFLQQTLHLCHAPQPFPFFCQYPGLQFYPPLTWSCQQHREWQCQKATGKIKLFHPLPNRQTSKRFWKLYEILFFEKALSVSGPLCSGSWLALILLAQITWNVAVPFYVNVMSYRCSIKKDYRKTLRCHKPGSRPYNFCQTQVCLNIFLRTSEVQTKSLSNVFCKNWLAHNIFGYNVLTTLAIHKKRQEHTLHYPSLHQIQSLNLQDT